MYDKVTSNQEFRDSDFHVTGTGPQIGQIWGSKQ